MYQIFSIHSCVDGHLGYFLVLAIVNSAAMNVGVYFVYSLFMRLLIGKQADRSDQLFITLFLLL